MSGSDPADGRPDLRPAVVIYGACIAVAFGWGALAGRPALLYLPGRATWGRAGLATLLGIGGGLGVVLLSRLALRRFAWSRELFGWFVSVLGPLSRRQAALLALLSALGEELLFRGALQPSLGLWLTSLLFALAHFPPRRRFWPWTATAGALGLLLGELTLWSGSVAGAVAAHFVINALNLALLGRFAPPEKLPAPGPAPSIDPHEPQNEPARDPDPDPDPRDSNSRGRAQP